MWQVKKCLCFFLCYTTLIITEVRSNKLLKLKTDAEDLGITSQVVGKTESKIFINKNEYITYTYNSISKSDRQFDDGTVKKLYICINCEFAKWTQHELLKLIEHLPLLYQSSFLSVHDDLFFKYFNDVSKAQYVQISKYTKRFMNILLKFINVYLNAYDTSIDTSIFRSLLSLNFKMKYIVQVLNESITFEKTDTYIIRTILSVLNTIQTFTTLNCQVNSERTDIDTFLDDISPLSLEAHMSCNVKDMILEEKISTEFHNITWTTNSGSLKVGHVLQMMKYTHDLDIISWYHKNMFNAFIKLLLTKIRSHYVKHHELPPSVTTIITTVYYVLQDISNLPSDLNDLFLFFAKEDRIKLANNEDLIKALDSYLVSLSDINLQYVLEPSSLLDFSIYLNSISTELKCFVRLFEYLQSETNIFNSSFTEKWKKIEIFQYNSQQLDKSTAIQILKESDLYPMGGKPLVKQDYEINKNTCCFFSGMFHYFLETIICLNLSLENNFVLDINSVFFSQAHYTVKQAIDLLSNLFQNSTHYPHLKIFSDILPFLELFEKNVLKKYSDLKRLIYVVMTKTNKYGIEYCNPPEFNFLLLNNIDFGVIGLLNTNVHKEVTMYSDLIKTAVEYNPSRRYSSILDFVKQFSTYKLEQYDAIINTYWKGEKKSITFINDCLTTSVVDLAELYSLYHTYIKFFLAVLYYEIYDFYKRGKRNGYQFKFLESLKNQFPAVFKDIILNMYLLISSYTGTQRVNISIADLNKTINNQFNKKGVFLNTEPSISHSDSYNIDQHFADTQSSINMVITCVNFTNNHVRSNYVYNQLPFNIFSLTGVPEKTELKDDDNS